jgi:hypothetical protein
VILRQKPPPRRSRSIYIRWSALGKIGRSAGRNVTGGRGRRQEVTVDARSDRLSALNAGIFPTSGISRMDLGRRQSSPAAAWSSRRPVLAVECCLGGAPTVWRPGLAWNVLKLAHASMANPSSSTPTGVATRERRLHAGSAGGRERHHHGPARPDRWTTSSPNTRAQCVKYEVIYPALGRSAASAAGVSPAAPMIRAPCSSRAARTESSPKRA